MNQLTAQGIILSRTDFGEADRIITMLTPDQGKLRLVARGVRKMKSKLAGGIELFSISHITYIKGRGDLDTLISTRLERHYEHIVRDINRTMLGYELIKILNKATEDEPEPEYFDLLHQSFEALDDATIDLALVRLWFAMQLVRLGGHTPNLMTDTAGERLSAERSYSFSFDDMAFAPSERGSFTANLIKFMRLGFDGHHAKTLSQVQGSSGLAEAAMPLVQTMLQTYIRT
jgi:DNA repair protein RecO (recombination protein O)